jgi:hypothetical protein
MTPEHKFCTPETANALYILKANDCAESADYYRNPLVLEWLTKGQQRVMINRWQRLAMEYADKIL